MLVGNVDTVRDNGWNFRELLFFLYGLFYQFFFLGDRGDGSNKFDHMQ